MYTLEKYKIYRLVMVIIATVKMKGRRGKHKEIVQTINGIADRIRQRKGCLGVSSYQDVNDENSFYHVEQWHTRRDLYNHFDSKLFSVLLGIKSILEEPPEIEILHKKTTALDKEGQVFSSTDKLKKQMGLDDE